MIKTTVEVRPEVAKRIRKKAQEKGMKIKFLVDQALSEAFPPEEAAA